MPRFDLRQDDGSLHPLAPFKVLAVMCHPSDRVRRERMLGNIEKETGTARPRRAPVTAETFNEEVRYASRRAAVAGSLMLTMLQLHHSGRRASLNQAIPLVTALLPKWEQQQSPYWSEICHFEHRPRSKTTMLKAYNEFQSVVHFWAALLHGQQHQREDIWPGASQTLPTFLSYADAVLELACALPSIAGNRRFARGEAWSFILPEQIGPAQLLPLPLNEEQVAILNEH